MKYLVRAANVWWRCAQHVALSLVAKFLETIDVCIWRMFDFMSVVVVRLSAQVHFNLGLSPLDS